MFSVCEKKVLSLITWKYHKEYNIAISIIKVKKTKYEILKCASKVA